MPVLYSRDTVPDPDAAGLTAAARGFTGIPYGFLDIAYLGAVLALNLHPRWLLDLVLSQRTQICSQLVAQFGMVAGADWQCGEPDPQLVTPGMLASRI